MYKAKTLTFLGQCLFLSTKALSAVPHDTRKYLRRATHEKPGRIGEQTDNQALVNAVV